MRPAIDTLIAPFIHVDFDQIASIVAKSTYPYRGQTRLALTVAAHAPRHPERRPNTRTATLMSIPGPRGSIPMTREVDAPPGPAIGRG
jgi:acetoin:2,6-dichlorophenolindophenol oxidoreductase subunit beta